MRLSSWVVGLVALVTVSSRAAAQPRLDPPAEVLVVVAIGADPTLDALRGFANQIQPGMGMMLNRAALRTQLAPLVAARSLDGLDDRAPLYVLLVDDGALKGAVLAGKVREDGKLTAGAAPAHVVKKGGWVVIGPKVLADKAAPFALDALPAQRAPAAPSATVFTQHVLDRYRSELDQGVKQVLATMPGGGAFSKLMQSYLDGLMSAWSDSERAIVTLEPTKDLLTIDFALVPAQATRLARFAALQQRSDYSLLGKLPAGAMSMIVAGHLETGPYRSSILELVGQFYAASGASSMTPAMDAIMRATTGDFAMAITGTVQAMDATQLLGLADPKGADRAMAQLIDGLGTGITTDMMGALMTMKSSGKPITHAGVTLRGYTTSYDLSKMTAANRQLFEKSVPKTTMSSIGGVVDGIGVVGVSARGSATAIAAVDAVRHAAKRYAPPAAITAFLAASRARKESVVAVMDMAAMGMPTSGHFMMALGFADKNLHLRVGVPASIARGAAGGP